MPLSASVTEETNIGKLETLTDNNRGTCQWIRGNSSLRLKYSKTYNITSVTVISPINTKGELNELNLSKFRQINFWKIFSFVPKQ